MALEGKHGGGDVSIALIGCSDPNGRVGGVGSRLIAKHHVKIIEVTRSQQQRIIGRAIIDPTVNTEVFPAVEHGFINFDQTVVVHVLEIQSNIALPARPCLGDQAHIGVDRVVQHVGDALVEGIDPGQDPLDPTFSQLWHHVIGPLVDCRVSSVGRAVTHGDIVVTQRLNPRPTQGVDVLAHAVGLFGLQWNPASIQLPGRICRHGQRSTVDRGRNEPLILIVAELACQIRGMLKGHLLIQRVAGIDHLKLTSYDLLPHPQHMQ